jgi:hypothetical protein
MQYHWVQVVWVRHLLHLQTQLKVETAVFPQSQQLVVEGVQLLQRQASAVA